LGVLLQSSCGSRPAGAGGYFSLELVALDAEDGAPVSGLRARAFLPDGDELPERQSDDRGLVRWDRVVEGVVVRLEDPKQRFVAVERRVREGEDSIRFKLVAGFTKTLRVVTDSGLRDGASDGSSRVALPTPAVVDVWPLDGIRERVITDAEGRATIGPLARGEVKLAVSAPGYETTIFDISVRSRRSDIGELRLERGGAELRGRVDTAGRARATHVSYRLQGVLLETEVGRGGHFVLSGLPRGVGTVVVRQHHRELFTRDVKIDGNLVDLGDLRPGEVASIR
jgi:hypothetical protein